MPPEQAAQLTALHVEHHLRLGFAGYSVFLTPDYFAAFARHPRLALDVASGEVAQGLGCRDLGRGRDRAELGEGCWAAAVGLALSTTAGPCSHRRLSLVRQQLLTSDPRPCRDASWCCLVCGSTGLNVPSRVRRRQARMPCQGAASSACLGDAWRHIEGPAVDIPTDPTALALLLSPDTDFKVSPGPRPSP